MSHPLQPSPTGGKPASERPRVLCAAYKHVSMYHKSYTRAAMPPAYAKTNMQAYCDVSQRMASSPQLCTLGNPNKSQDVYLRSPADLYQKLRRAFCTRRNEHASMSQCSATRIVSLPHMCTVGSPGNSPDKHLRSALHLYHTRVLSEVLVKQQMIICGRPSMESKNATRRCGNLLRTF